MHKAGKPIPIDDLPTPPGFGPIPDPRSAPVASASVSPSGPIRGTMSGQNSGSSLVVAGAAAAAGKQPPPSPQPSVHSQAASPASSAASPSEAEKPKRKSMSLQVSSD